MTLLLFCFGRPKQEVFFDRICIHPGDEALKLDAIFSLAGILKESKDSTKKNQKTRWTVTESQYHYYKTCHMCFFSSQTKRYKRFDSIRYQEMLVLWDQSWSSRLWCLFELAAFLKSTVDSDSKGGCKDSVPLLSHSNWWGFSKGRVRIQLKVQSFCLLIL